MRFDDDTAAPTTLVRTPPGHEGERITYEVSDEYVGQAVAAIKEHLSDDEQPIVGRIDAPTSDEIESGAAQYVDENPGQDALADYATMLAFQAHEQKTGERIDESGRFDLDTPDEDVAWAVTRPSTPEEAQPVDENGDPIPTPPEQPAKKATAAEKRAAREHAAAKE